MVITPEKTLDRIFYALSDSSRRTMLRELASHDCQVKDLADFFSFSKAATSKHIAVLEEAGLIDKTRAGREVRCSINPATLQTIERWAHSYRQFWNERFDALDAIVSTKPKSKKK